MVTEDKLRLAEYYKALLTEKAETLGRYPTKAEIIEDAHLPSYNTLWRLGISFTKERRLFRCRIPKTVCKWCGEEIMHTRRTLFCSQSCAAYYSGKHKDKSKKPGPKKFIGPPTPPIPPEEFVGPIKPKTDYRKQQSSVCVVCGGTFDYFSTRHRKVCSKDCRISILRENRTRAKKSYMERTFCEWLDERRVAYECEVTIKNPLTGKWAFVDFLFADLNLIIELDGKQHLLRKEEDAERDAWISNLGYRVLRVSHEDYQSKALLPEICNLLRI